MFNGCCFLSRRVSSLPQETRRTFRRKMPLGIRCARTYRTLRDGLFLGTLSQALRARLRFGMSLRDVGTRLAAISQQTRARMSLFWIEFNPAKQCWFASKRTGSAWKTLFLCYSMCGEFSFNLGTGLIPPLERRHLKNKHDLLAKVPLKSGCLTPWLPISFLQGEKIFFLKGQFILAGPLDRAAERI